MIVVRANGDFKPRSKLDRKPVQEFRKKTHIKYKTDREPRITALDDRTTGGFREKKKLNIIN